MKKQMLLGCLVMMLVLGGCGAGGELPTTAMPGAESSQVIEAKNEESAAAETSTKASQEAVQPTTATPASITVNGDGEIKVEPDMAEVTFGVRSTGGTAAKAQQDNTEAVDQVLAMLESLGIAEKSIQTSDYSLYPRYDDYGENITSYTASTTLTVSDLPIDSVGTLLTKCTDAGINDIDDIRYFHGGYDAAYEDALNLAVEAARKKAEALAASSGQTLGAIQAITEGYQDTSLRYSYDSGMAAKYAVTEEDAGGDVSIMPGEVTVRAQVTVTFSLE